MGRYTHQTGRSMIEMLGVLAIIAVLTIGGIAGYSKALMMYRTDRVLSQITHTVARTRVAFISQKNYAGLGEDEDKIGDVLVNADILPKDTIIRDKEGNAIIPYRFKNPFKGNISMRIGNKSQKGDKSAFIIHYDYIPKSACIEIATSAWGDINGSGFVMLSINKPLSNKMNGRNCESTPISQMESAIHCSHDKIMLNAAAAHACQDKDNTLELMFY